MAGTAAVQYKIMPESPDTNLSEILKEAKKIIESKQGAFSNSEEQPIAFGLKALTISFAFPEENEIEEIGNALEKINGVSSAEMIDYRRALG